MKVDYFGLTDTGKTREKNEDYFIVQPVIDGKCILAIVADGVGGNPAGEVASRLACEQMVSYINETTGNEDYSDLLFSALVYANNEIVKLHSLPQYNNMSCVMSTALLDISSGELYISHVGDSRLFVKRGKTLYKLTQDHNVAGEQEDQGMITEEERMRHPRRNLITRSIGNRVLSHFYADYVQMERVKLRPPCSVLICSDGLYDMIKSSEISKILSLGDNIQERVKTLIKAANIAGGKDNITSVLIEIKPD